MSWRKYFFGLVKPSSIEGLEKRVKDLEEDLEKLRVRIVKIERGPELKFGEKVRFMNKHFLYVDAIYLKPCENGKHSVVWINKEEDCISCTEELNVFRRSND